MKICKSCNEEQPVDRFGTARTLDSGHRILKTNCKACDNRTRKARKQRNGKSPADLRHQESVNLRNRLARASGEQRERWILQDSRRSDKRKGLCNDLTTDFIAKMIARR